MGLSRPMAIVTDMLVFAMMSCNASVQVTALENVEVISASAIEVGQATEMTDTMVVATTTEDVSTTASFAVEPIIDVVEEKVEVIWDGPILNRVNGTVKGPSGKETYYNLNMSRVVSIMRELGYDYEYWVREDGVKMFGEYVMCAANLEIRPKGTIVETSLGTAIVCDTGSFAKANPYQLDIAVSW